MECPTQAGFDYYGHDLLAQPLPNMTLQACAQACQGHEACTFHVLPV